MEFIDDAEFQIAIDNDNGARITSLKWRDNEFAVPFRGQVHTSGWYAMAPWAGRINEGLIKDAQGQKLQINWMIRDNFIVLKRSGSRKQKCFLFPIRFLPIFCLHA